MSASAWVHILDFTKSLSTVTIKMTENVVLLFIFVYVLSLICLFIISGEFDALHQLSVKKDPLEIQHPKLENNRRGPFMRDNGRWDILHAA